METQRSISVKELLQKLDVGSSVAEHDADLERYFVETATFRQLIEDKGDVIAGDKGTGKTALYKILKERYSRIPELASTKLIPAFNPQGTPVFKRVLEAGVLDEGQYIGIWKAYFLSLAGNWLLDSPEIPRTEEIAKVDQLLKSAGLRQGVNVDSEEGNAKKIFTALIRHIKRLMSPVAAEHTVTFTGEGLPVITQRVEFDTAVDADIVDRDGLIRHDDALELLNDAFESVDLTLWLIMDRLDEAFQSSPESERPALRALFRTYLDMQNFDQLRLKLFVRRDLFGRIIEGGFVNLTHINARRIEIIWDEEDLYALLLRRVMESKEFIANLQIGPQADLGSIFDVVFPEQVNPGDRKPKTWRWIMARIRDGNGVRSPRNLIDLVLKAQDAQLRAEDRHNRYYSDEVSLITGESLKRGLETLSATRMEDTLLAEAGSNAELVKRFKDGKAEHNKTTLNGILGNQMSEGVAVLQSLGFLEQIGETYKIPMLYRSGLNITQGRAYASGAHEDDDDEDSI